MRKVCEVGMTREEAIKILDILPLCNECDSNNFPYTCVDCGDAFLLAMEALKQPEIVKCKDCAYAIFKEGLVQPGHIVCTKPFTEHWQSVKPNNWFCANAERKEI